MINWSKINCWMWGCPFSLKVQNACFCNKLSVNQAVIIFPSYLHCIASNAELCHGFLCCASQQIKIASLPSQPSKTSLKGRSQLKDQTMGLGLPNNNITAISCLQYSPIYHSHQIYQFLNFFVVTLVNKDQIVVLDPYNIVEIAFICFLYLQHYLILYLIVVIFGAQLHYLGL